MSQSPQLSFSQTVILITVSVLILFFIVGSDRRAIETGTALPNGAINIVSVGQGWYEFSYKNQRFLYHQYKVGTDMAECLSAIEER